MKRIILLSAVFVLGITACKKNDPPFTPGPVTYGFYVPATMIPQSVREDKGIIEEKSAIFQEAGKVHLYNKTTDTWYGPDQFLTPSEVNPYDNTCKLVGTLSGDINVDDVIMLMYDMDIVKEELYQCNYDYVQGQDGTLANLPDGALATLKVKAIEDNEITFCQENGDGDETARFSPLTARVRVRFIDEDNNPITVRSVRLFGALVLSYRLFQEPQYQIIGGEFPIVVSTPTSEDIFLGVPFNEEESLFYPLIFDVTSTDGVVYSGSYYLNGGYKNGYDYTFTSPIQVVYFRTLTAPDITWTTPSSPAPLSAFYRYEIADENVDITLSGTDDGYSFYLKQNGTVRLNNFKAATNVNSDSVVYADGNLTLDISGDNTLCPPSAVAVVSNKELKLKGKGTLTVGTRGTPAPYYCGLLGNQNYSAGINHNDITEEVDVSEELAAPGYTVIRGPRSESDGVYSWTYTVSPKE